MSNVRTNDFGNEFIEWMLNRFDIDIRRVAIRYPAKVIVDDGELLIQLQVSVSAADVCMYHDRTKAKPVRAEVLENEMPINPGWEGA